MQGVAKLQSDALIAFTYDTLPGQTPPNYSDVGLPENPAWQAGMSRHYLVTRTLSWLKTPEEQDYFAEHAFAICVAQFLRTTPSVMALPSEPLAVAQLVLPYVYILVRLMKQCMTFAALFDFCYLV